MTTFNLTPDPKVLLALTHTPMQPLDALCELVDNALDSFQDARLQGQPIKNPLVAIELPRQSDLRNGAGTIQVRDNGMGLTIAQAELALRAGYSGNNPYDSLGLFGMGFNIATGKLGSVTRFRTARIEASDAMEVTVDLEQIRQSQSFQVPVSFIDKPTDFTNGTLVQIDRWWPEGNPNSGFIRKLVQYGLPKIREEIGRRYATVLKGKNIQILVNSEPCHSFEHCVWADSRTVERRGIGKIPAMYRFDELLTSQSRCVQCHGLVSAGRSSCQTCNSANLRTIEERIRGWVGIQRFDDGTNFGIDLIRNGRTIRISEKTAFFEFTNEFKHTIKDYPIDGTFGRIVGEIHLNHVPVDFLKQDFQRSSPEWQRAITFLRGDSSLQPTQAGAAENGSPIYKLYQGYRRVRNYGRADMYMGVWDTATEGPRRISREVEKEYFAKFSKKEAGFYDDSEWWKLVEQADSRPLEALVLCPECNAQNLKGHDACIACAAVLVGTTCVHSECSKQIPLSAASCPHCGTSQLPELVRPWSCQVCGERNSIDASSCSTCATPKGTLNPMSRDHLLANSSKNDELSIAACTVLLADDSNSSPLDIATYVTKEPIIPSPKSKSIPIYSIKTPERIEIYADLNHPLFKSYRVRPEQLIAAEVALVLYDSNRRLSGRQYEGLHTLSTLAWQILQAHWKTTLEDNADRVKSDIDAFFSGLRERLPIVLEGHIDNIYDDFNDAQKKIMVDKMLDSGVDLMNLPAIRLSGQYLTFIDENTIVSLFRQFTSSFFDGRFWAIPWDISGDLSTIIIEDVRNRNKFLVLNCLEDLVSYLRYKQPDPIIVQRARGSLQLLQNKIA